MSKRSWLREMAYVYVASLQKKIGLYRTILMSARTIFFGRFSWQTSVAFHFLSPFTRCPQPFSSVSHTWDLSYNMKECGIRRKLSKRASIYTCLMLSAHVNRMRDRRAVSITIIIKWNEMNSSHLMLWIKCIVWIYSTRETINFNLKNEISILFNECLASHQHRRHSRVKCFSSSHNISWIITDCRRWRPWVETIATSVSVCWVLTWMKWEREMKWTSDKLITQFYNWRVAYMERFRVYACASIR